jgi:TPR repeat protein
LLLMALPGAAPVRGAVADDGLGSARAVQARQALQNARERARAAKQQARAERRILRQLRRAEQRMRMLCPQPAAVTQSPGQPAGAGEDRARLQAEALARTGQLPLIVTQYALKGSGAYPGRVDGLNGPATVAAIKTFQRRLGASADGRLSPEQTVALVQMAAAHGQAESENTLGMMLASGVGLPRNDAAAVDWFRRAADQGNPFGTYNLGVMYRDGRGVVTDRKEAARLIPEAPMADCLRAEAALKELSR